MQILDRVLGKATHHVEGRLELRRADLVAQAKQELQAEVDAQAPRARAKLAELIERRAWSIANGDGNGS